MHGGDSLLHVPLSLPAAELAEGLEAAIGWS